MIVSDNSAMHGITIWKFKCALRLGSIIISNQCASPWCHHALSNYWPVLSVEIQDFYPYDDQVVDSPSFKKSKNPRKRLRELMAGGTFVSADEVADLIAADSQKSRRRR